MNSIEMMIVPEIAGSIAANLLQQDFFLQRRRPPRGRQKTRVYPLRVSLGNHRSQPINNAWLMFHSKNLLKPCLRRIIADPRIEQVRCSEIQYQYSVLGSRFSVQ